MSKEKNKNDIQEISASLGLHYLDLEKAIERIKLGMFFKYYRQNPKDDWEKDFNQRVKDAFKRYTDNEFDPSFIEKLDVAPLALMGPPGHGKTTAFKVAAKWFAKETGLEFVDRVEVEDYQNGGELNRDTFLFISQEFSGEVSKASIGLPFKSVGKINVEGAREEVEVAYMKNMMPSRFALMRYAGASVLLLDDLPNASPTVQNLALSMTQEQRFQDMNYTGVYIGVTGNLGATDGTNTNRVSSALVSRLEMHVVADTTNEFIIRLLDRTADKIGDLGLSSFLKRNPDNFWHMPSKGSFPCPRTWDKAIDAMRGIVYSKGGNLAESLEEIQRTIPAFIGSGAAQQTHAYLHQIAIGADPLAKKMISDGIWDQNDRAVFDKGYKGGFGSSSLDFSYQLGSAMADHAAHKIILDPRHEKLQDIYEVAKQKTAISAAEMEKIKSTAKEILKEPIERFLIGLSHVKDTGALAFGVHQLTDKLSYQLKGWSHVITKENMSTRVLRYEIKEIIAKTVDELINRAKADKDNSLLDHIRDARHMAPLIDAITNYDLVGDKPKTKR